MKNPLFALSSFAILLTLVVVGPLSGQTVTTMIDNGASSNRVDMIFIGDGYQAHELESTYVTHLQGTLDHFFNNNQAPFPRYNKFFNAHRVNIASNESGADDPRNNIFVDTALDASYNTGGVDRCLYFNTSKANAAVSTALSGTSIDVDMRLGSVNSTKYGGCGGQWGVYAGGNSSANEIAIHEIGHSFANLADEYFSPGQWNGGEPGEVNVTSDPSLGKWDRWVGYVDPDNNIGAINYYEGARYYAEGLYRPSQNSKMRSLNRPFDAVSREQFISKIYDEVDPLDAWLDDSETYYREDTLWVDTVDPDVILVEWFVNGESVGFLGESVDIDTLGLSNGEHTVTAFAYDEILDNAFSGNSLDWWRRDDTSKLEQSITWTVDYTAVPEPSQYGMMAVISVIGIVVIRRQRNRKLNQAA